MQEQRTVAILGGSLLMASLAASLGGQEALQVLPISGSGQDLAVQLAAVSPEVVIFDLDAPEARLLLDLFRRCHGLPFLALGVTGNMAMSLSSHTHAVRSAGDLAEFIERELGRPAPGLGTREN